jgi:hypothetical protein
MLARLGVKLFAGVDMPAHLADVLTYGVVMDCTRVASEFGWRPAFSTRQAMDAFARGKDAEVLEPPSPPQEYELQVYLQQRRRRALLPVARRAGGAE